jgi:CRISPR-associated protein Cmr3
MKSIKQWLRLAPVDTLFFKGSEPMVAGQNHEAASVFPPMPETIMGAIRTAILGQRDISLRSFLNGDRDKYADHPCLGTPERPGFEIAGPIFEITGRKRDIFLPAPAHWFAGSLKEAKPGTTVPVRPAQVCAPQFKALGLKGSVAAPLWVLKPEQEDLKSMSGMWVNLRAFETVTAGGGELHFAGHETETMKDHDPSVATVASAGCFYASESRTGIALESNRSRRVRKGYLYTFTQVRMQPNVNLLVGLSQSIAPNSLDEQGLLQLGGEQRIVKYEVAEAVRLPAGDSGWMYALGPVKAGLLQDEQADLADFPRASGPLIRMSGWDMKTRFHKPVSAFYPAGTVINVGSENGNNFFGFLNI